MAATGTAAVDVWVTVIEFVPQGGAVPPFFDLDEIDAMVEQLETWDPKGVWCCDRYALVLRLPATGASQALDSALQYHGQARRRLRLRPVDLVRVEVLTLEEMERCWQEFDPDDEGTDFDLDTEAVVPTALHNATRGLLAAATPADVNAIIDDFVSVIGAQIHPGAPCHPPGDIDVDLTIDRQQPRHATAQAFSMTGLIMSQWLPNLVVDAGRAWARRQPGSISSRAGEQI